MGVLHSPLTVWWLNIGPGFCNRYRLGIFSLFGDEPFAINDEGKILVH